MQIFDLPRIIDELRQSGRLYLEFLRSREPSVGVYELPSGANDPQRPHTEAEVYYVVSGRATVRVGGEDRPVGPGAVVFVEAGVEHRFHTITEKLTLLVFFAPAEGTNRKSQS